MSDDDLGALESEFNDSHVAFMDQALLYDVGSVVVGVIAKMSELPDSASSEKWKLVLGSPAIKGIDQNYADIINWLVINVGNVESSEIDANRIRIFENKCTALIDRKNEREKR
jgi:hypothetical protein